MAHCRHIATEDDIVPRQYCTISHSNREKVGRGAQNIFKKGHREDLRLHALTPFFTMNARSVLPCSFFISLLCWLLKVTVSVSVVVRIAGVGRTMQLGVNQ